VRSKRAGAGGVREVARLSCGEYNRGIIFPLAKKNPELGQNGNLNPNKFRFKFPIRVMEESAKTVQK